MDIQTVLEDYDLLWSHTMDYMLLIKAVNIPIITFGNYYEVFLTGT